MNGPSELELFAAFQQSPLLWLKETFNLVPQRDNEKFEKGKHISRQQHDILLCVEQALQGKASRRISIRSGRGIGKSATCAWLLLWFLFCFKDAQIACTAPTHDQIHDVLWKEAALWLRLMPEWMQKLYQLQESYIRIVERPETWFARARTGKKENPEALAGIHSEHVLLIVDEASGVADEIFEVAEGNLTNENILVLLISNPRRLSGYFYETHHRQKKHWQTLHFSAIDSPLVPKTFIDSIRERYGEDHPIWPIEVLGEFPSTEEDQLISFNLFDSAVSRTYPVDLTAPRIGATDVARYGDDATVHCERQGQSGRLLSERRGQDTMATCGDIVKAIKDAERDENPYDFWCIDIIGLGSGVYDRAKELQGEGHIPKECKIIGVNVAETAMDDKRYVNRRAELADTYRDWLKTGSIDVKLREQTCSVKYKAPDSRGRLILEKKEEMKERGLDSPDRFDAFALTFAVGSATREKMQHHAKPMRQAVGTGVQRAWWR